MKYADAALYGNLAYDFNAIPAQEPEVEAPAREHYERHPRTRDNAKVSIGTATAVRTTAISPFAVIGTVVVVLLLLLMVMSYVSLSELSAQYVEYADELSKLELEEQRLKIEYEGAFDLNEVESYAMSELGMIKADSTQVAYVHRSTGDQAVILTEEADQGFLKSIGTFLSRFVEYFR